MRTTQPIHDLKIEFLVILFSRAGMSTWCSRWRWARWVCTSNIPAWLKQHRAITATHISPSDILKWKKSAFGNTREKLNLFKVMNKQDNRWDNNNPTCRNKTNTWLMFLEHIGGSLLWRCVMFGDCTGICTDNKCRLLSTSELTWLN